MTIAGKDASHQFIFQPEEKEPKPAYVLCSFEPDPIVEKEERERVNQLAQRDFLIRSYGMLEQVCYLILCSVWFT